jgi:hypothetical protein
LIVAVKGPEDEMKRAFAVSLFAAGALLFSMAALAHHGSGISYDMSKSIKLTGTVTEFVWSNPHCQVFFDVKDDKGNVVNWGGELGSPTVLRNAGYDRNVFKAGDRITVTGRPSKSGATVMLPMKVMFADGREFTNTIPASDR